LIAPDDAEASAPPTIVHQTRTGDGQPPAAIIIAVNVVNKRSDITFGLVSPR
jgi:hypothetical protein